MRFRKENLLPLRPKKVVGTLFLFVVALWVLPARPAPAAPTPEGAKSSRSKTAKKAAPAHRQSSAHHRRRRRSSYRARLARLQPKPERIRQIQEALIRAGFLKQEANGKWDTATREAMRSCQQAFGFQVTGLPEAKTLMKLGLGPHPLPADVDPSIVGRASTSAPAGDSAASASPDLR